ncbi:MFS transporter [Neobacillus mesonae]|uniref:MFS transporter n=1 Tax=Neobacillus mesonae TaxID=1193713 RepID=UPI00203F22B3|nr:MFS transporter [Neobacillus mesonae]MCM3570314.1 MFS transporter [Neobacillus mesonae]
MRNIWILSLVSFFTDLGTYMVYPLIPLFLASVGTTPTIIGLIEGIAESLASLLKLIAGYIADKVNKRKSLAIFGYGFSAIGRILLIAAHSWVGVFIWRMSDRIGKGVRTAPRDALIAESSVNGRHGRSFGFHQMLDMLGAAIGVGVAYLLIFGGHASYQKVFLYSMLPVVIGVALLFLIREPKDRKEEIMRKPIQFNWSVLDHRLKRLLVVIFLFTLVNSSNQFLILRASNVGVSTQNVLLLYLLFYLVSGLLSYPAGRLSDKVGRKSLLVLGYVFYGIVYFGFGLAQSAKWMWVLFVLYGVYTGATKGVERALVADVAPKDLKATVMGMYSMIVGIGLLPASLITGWLWDKFGADVPFYFNGVLSMITAILLYFAISNPNEKRL